MVKGMTRRIVEIRQPNSSYFEKAVFYCRTNIPKCTSEYTLKMEAQRIISQLCSDGSGLHSKQDFKAQQKKLKLSDVAKTFVSAVVGAAGAILIFRLH